MSRWLRRIRGALGMGAAWAVAWALVGILVGVSSELLPFLPWHRVFDVFDAPLPALALPGFVGGAIFSVVLGIVGRRRRFEELSLPRVAAWGAIGGVLLSLVPAALVSARLATLAEGGPGLWELTAMIGVPLTLLSSASAAGSLAIARQGARPTLPPRREPDAALPPAPGRSG